jgi:hypothetical protein
MRAAGTGQVGAVRGWARARRALLLPVLLLPAPAGAEAVAPGDRLGHARARLDAVRAAAFPAGVTRRALIAARLDPAAARPALPPSALAAVAPARLPPDPVPPGDAVARLLDLVASAEAGAAGYDAIHHAARRLPQAPPTELTLGEILDWVAATPGQNHAIGRYQFVPATLADLMRRTGTPRTARFDPALQDRLALRLMEDAGLSEFLSGDLPAAEFMDELAYVWAGLPLESGLSAYHGYNGNRATITRTAYAEGFAAIFPAR